jgi:photosystem II stability/assembly factor-like uncharacterized protein
MTSETLLLGSYCRSRTLRHSPAQRVSRTILPSSGRQRGRTALLIAIMCSLACFSIVRAQGWRQVHPSFPIDEYTSLCEAGHDTLILTALNFSLSISVDRGQHWTNRYRTPGAFDITRCGSDGSYLFLLPGGRPYYEALMTDTTQGFLYRYDPATRDTTRMVFPASFERNGNERYFLDMSTCRGAIFIMINSSLRNRCILLRSVDHGISWSTLSIPDSLEYAYSGIAFHDSACGFIIAREPADPTSGVLYATRNGGAQWVRSSVLRFRRNDGRITYPVAWVDDTTALAANDDGMIYKTTDGGVSWRIRHVGVSTTPMSITMNHRGTGFLTGSALDMWRTDDFGAHWIAIRAASRIAAYSQAVQFNDSTLIVVTAEGERFRTTDGGLTWSDERVLPYNGYSGLCFVDPINGYMDAIDNNAVALQKTHQRTTDGGRTWNRYPVPLQQWSLVLHIDERVAFAFAMRSAHGDTLAVKTVDGGEHWSVALRDTLADYAVVDIAGRRNRGKDTLVVFMDGWLLKTTDGGARWSTTPSLPYRLGVGEYLLTMDVSCQGHAWAMTMNRVLRSSDDGMTWDTVFVRPERTAESLRSMMVDAGDHVELLALSKYSPDAAPGALGQIFSSVDNGITWSSQWVYAFDPANSRGNSFLYSDGKGHGFRSFSAHMQGGDQWIFRSTLDGWRTSTDLLRLSSRSGLTESFFLTSSTGWLHQGNVLYFYDASNSALAPDPLPPTAIWLAPSYPNPAAGEAVIPYAVEGAAARQVRIELYDALGRRVRTLFDGEAAAGEHRLRVETGGMKPGVYFVVLDAGGRREVKKMVVER